MSPLHVRGAHVALIAFAVVAFSVLYLLGGAVLGSVGANAKHASRHHEPSRPESDVRRDSQASGETPTSRARPIVLDGLVGQDATAAAATLLLSSSPPGLVVHVDGREVGPLPKNVRDLAPGHHLVTASLPAFEPFARDVELEASDVEALVVRLDPVGPGGPGEFGYLRVDDATPGRTVRLLGVDVGATPLEHVPVPSGAYLVTIVDSRGRTDERAVLVTANRETTMVARPATRHAIR